MCVAADGYFGVCDRDCAGDRDRPREDIATSLFGLLGDSDSEEDIVGIE